MSKKQTSDISISIKAPNSNGVTDVASTAKDEESKTHSNPNKDGGYGWVILVSAFFLQGLSSGPAYSTGVYYSEWLDVFQGGQTATAWIASVHVSCMAFMCPFSSALVNRFGCRRVCLVGSFALTTSLFVSAFAPNIGMLICVYGVFGGISCSVVYMSGIVIINEYFDRRKVLALGLSIAGIGIGNLVFPPLLRLWIDGYGWRGALMFEAGLVAHCCVCSALFRPLDDSMSRGEKKGKIDLKDMFGCSILLKARFWIFMASCPLWQIGMTFLFMAPDFVYESGFSKDSSAWVLSAFGLASTVGRLFTAVVGGRGCFKKPVLYAGSLFLRSIMLSVFTYYKNYTNFVVCSSVQGFAWGVQLTLLGVVISDLFGPALFSNAFGYSFFASGFGVLLGPPLAGLLYEVQNSYELPFYAFSLVIFLSGCLAVLAFCEERVAKRCRGSLLAKPSAVELLTRVHTDISCQETPS